MRRTPSRTPAPLARTHARAQYARGVARVLEVGVFAGDFGAAQIDGLDPDDATVSAHVQTVRTALATHAVVCLRFPRALTDDEARVVASMVGPIKDPIGRTRDGGELRYSEDRQIIDAGFVLTDELRAELGDLNFGGLDPQRPGLFETFHTDDTYTERPAAATVLHARELPSSPGGATHFMDMRAAYRQLGDDEQAALVGLRVAHRYNNDGAFPPRIPAQGPYEALVDVEHPLVRAHPV